MSTDINKLNSLRRVISIPEGAIEEVHGNDAIVDYGTISSCITLTAIQDNKKLCSHCVLVPTAEQLNAASLITIFVDNLKQSSSPIRYVHIAGAIDFWDKSYFGLKADLVDHIENTLNTKCIVLNTSDYESVNIKIINNAVVVN